MEIKEFIEKWIATGNSYNTVNYLSLYHEDAMLDDPSVGKKFAGHSGIRQYFEDYFIEYKTQTRLLNLSIISDNSAHIEVEFTGEFPEGKINGIFDFIVKDGKIAAAKADLI